MTLRAWSVLIVLVFAGCNSDPLGADDAGDGDVTNPGGTTDGSFTVTAEPAGAHCATGGIVVTTVSSTSYVCNGLPGTNAAAATVAAEPAGANCVAGGVSVSAAGTVFYICDGADGVDGANGANGTNGADGHTYVITTEAPGFNCKSGGSGSRAPTAYGMSAMAEPRQVCA